MKWFSRNWWKLNSLSLDVFYLIRKSFLNFEWCRKSFLFSVSNFGYFCKIGIYTFVLLKLSIFIFYLWSVKHRWISNELEHHFSNIERIWTCSSIDDQIRTPEFWPRTNRHRTQKAFYYLDLRSYSSNRLENHFFEHWTDSKVFIFY